MFSKTLIFIIFLSLMNTLYATEYYLKESHTYREYLVVAIDELHGFTLKKYGQEKGSYQDLMIFKKFSNRSDVIKEINQNYKQYEKVRELPIWEIENPKSEGTILELRGLFGSKKHSAIWHAKNKWDEEWEKKFSKWIQEEVKEDFYVKYNLATDCADAVVALRWIFARMYSLPVASTLADTRNLFGNYSIKKDWRKLSTAQNWYEDKLFLTALDYIMNLTSTRTIINDGYPVSLNSQGLVPGVFIVTQNEGGGHVKFISEIHSDETNELPFYTLASTTPRKTRLLNKEVMLDQDWSEYGIKDILAFKWPEVINGKWQLSESRQRNNYSQEQYDLSLRVSNPIFIEYVFKNLEGNYNPYRMIEIGAHDMARYLEQRVEIVNKGHIVCQSRDCSLNTVEDSNWGTRSRDEKIIQKFNDLDILVKEFSKIHPYLNRKWMQVLKETKVKINEYELSLFVIKYIFNEKMHSSLASDSIDKRWGLDVRERVNSWGNEVIELLDQRNKIINNVDYTCDEKCQPRDSMWLSLSTYHIDSALNKASVKLRNFCHMFGESLCTDTLNAIKFDKKYHGIEKNLEEWINVIPFLNSDPKATKDSRWAILASNIKARVLPIHEKEVYIAKNEMALIDQDLLYDLDSETNVYRAGAAESLYLNSEGFVIKVDNLKSQYQAYQDGKWLDLNSWNETFKDASQIKIIVDEESFIIKHIRNGYVDIYLYQENHLSFIGKSQKKFKTKDEYIYFVTEDNKVIFYNRYSNKQSLIDSNFFGKIKDLSLLEIESVIGAEIILSYEDKDEDFYTSFAINLKDLNVKRINSDQVGNYKVLWSSPSLKKMIVKAQWNREFPVTYLISWNDNEVKTKDLYNDAHSFKIVNQELFFISSEGGQWDQKPRLRLYRWSESLSEITAYSKDYRPVASTEIGYYFLSNSGGLIHDFNQEILMPAPAAMTFGRSNCSLEKGTKDYLSFRFDSSYGDYLCMGGIIPVKTLQDNLTYLIPVLTIYPWINADDLVDNHWSSVFNKSVVRKGVLTTNGLNNSFWLSLTE